MEISWAVYLLVEWIRGVWNETFDFVSRLDWPQFIATFWGTFFLDIPRYVITDLIALGVALRQRLKDRGLQGEFEQRLLANPPLVSVIVPAHNEEKVIPSTLRSLFEQTYPNLEIIVVDDGSTDRTYEICRPLAERGLIRLFRHGARMGKSAAGNIAFKASRGNYVVIIDSDSTFDRDAFLNLMKYFCDPKVGAVAGNLRVLNGVESLATKLQSLEYLLTISVGRRFSSLANILYIVSGAFGAFRREVFEAMGGFDVGPGEDADNTVKARKLGVKIAFAPDAICLTEVPDTFGKLVRQRLRWERDYVRLWLRKHRDLVNPTWAAFRLSNFIGYLDGFFFQFLLALALPVYVLYLIIFYPHLLLIAVILTWIGYTLITTVQLGIALCLSERPWEDLRLLPYTTLYSLYQIGFLRPIRLRAFLEELFFRRSYEDPYIPPRVAKENIRW